jgi:hypothetical protein
MSGQTTTSGQIFHDEGFFNVEIDLMIWCFKCVLICFYLCKHTKTFFKIENFVVEIIIFYEIKQTT